MTVLHIDFETRSTVDLKAAGIDNYAKHPDTDVWCMAWAFDDEEPQIWHPGLDRDIEEVRKLGRVMSHVVHGAGNWHGGQVVAHNASFELAIWNLLMVPRYRWPPLRPEQVRCTMAQAYAMALPGSLEKAAAAVGIQEQKDIAGGRLMMQMAKPRGIGEPDWLGRKCDDCAGTGLVDDDGRRETNCNACGGTGEAHGPKPIWWDEADKLERLYEYCRQDVRVERQLDTRLMPLSDAEQRLWVLDQTINNRGVYVDRPAVAKAIAVVEAEADRLNEEMRRVTGNFVGFCTETKRLADWIRMRGVRVDGVAKADVLDALALDGTPPDVRQALLLRQEAGKSSTAKLKAMISAASSDGRLRGMLQYHGAGTGRWAGRRVQLQNIPRWPEWFGLDDAEACIAKLLATPDPRAAADWIRFLYDSPLTIVSYLLRPLLCAAPGNDLLAADFANIEGRGLAWLAGEEWKLEAFRAYDAGTGPDLYKVMAARIYGVDLAAVTKDRRQIGKVAELACGYQGGVGAFQQMAKTYLVKVPDDIAEMAKTKWREANPLIKQYWYDLEEAAMQAVLKPGMKQFAGPQKRQVVFLVRGSFLWCLLPSGRALCYPYPKIKSKMTPWGEPKDCIHYMHVDGMSNKWVETHTYGGKLAENVTQAICRDLLASAIERCEAAGYPVVLHVHDEVVSERRQGEGDLAEFEALCAETPAWAEGLPVTAAGWRGRRYRK